MTPEQLDAYEILARGNNDKAVMAIINALRVSQSEMLHIGRLYKNLQRDHEIVLDKLHAIRKLTEVK